MRQRAITETWVVYQANIRGKLFGTNAVCEQSVWEAMERERPGFHTLIKAGITNEGEAERYARSIPAGKQPVPETILVAPTGGEVAKSRAGTSH